MPSTLILHLFFKRKLQINHLPSLFLQFSPLISSSQLASNCSSDHLPSRSFLRRLVAAETENSRNLTGIILLHSFAFTNGRRSCLPWSRLCRTIARPYLSSISSWPSSRLVLIQKFRPRHHDYTARAMQLFHRFAPPGRHPSTEDTMKTDELH